MSAASRPAHYVLTPAEQAQNDAEHQRSVEGGFLAVTCLAVTPMAAAMALVALAAFGWL